MGEMIFLVLIVFASSVTFAQADLPSPEVRVNALKAIASEMRRLDGEALYVRRNRAIPWDETVIKLEKEAENATSWFAFMKPLLRLNLAYPNLHSSMVPGQDAMKYLPKRIQPKVGFTAEWLTPNQVRYVVSRVDQDVQYTADVEPQVGDEVVEINGRSVDDWKNENFELCKFPLRAQCDFEFTSTFQKELLSWSRQDSLTYTLKRNETTWTIVVDLREEGTYFPAPQGDSCRQEQNRYSDFKLVYGGNLACVYESTKYPGTAIFRITGFNYSKDILKQEEPIDSLNKEIDALYPWWVQHATWDHLVFDIIDNHGGNAPIGYYQILFQHDFQEQFVTFKKTPEIEDPILRKSIFWDSKGQEIWFQNLVSSGKWSKIFDGHYTEPVPMFCPDENKDCSVGLFPVRQHPFRGRISVLLNQWCVSSCDGFAYNLKEKFGARATFYGHPQAADTAYSRLTINIHLDSKLKEGFRLETVPLYDSSSQNAFMSQTIVVTRSTTQNGTVVSGVPVPLDGFVPYTLQNKDSWPNEVLKHAL